MDKKTTVVTKVAIFRRKEIRKVIYKNEWWFSVVDVCKALTDSIDSGAYWRKLKQRLIEEGSEVVTFCHGLKLQASDGKKAELFKLSFLFSLSFPRKWESRIRYAQDILYLHIGE